MPPNTGIAMMMIVQMVGDRSWEVPASARRPTQESWNMISSTIKAVATKPIPSTSSDANASSMTVPRNLR